MLRKFILAVALTLPAAVAQDKEVSILPGEYGYAEVKAYLSLTDAQVQSLQNIVRERQQAEMAIYRQIGEKQMTLNQLLQGGTTDALRVGQLTLEINTLQRQVPIPGGPYQQQALNVLNQEQKAKLPALDSAVRLASTAYQASYLSLITLPEQRGIPRTLPGFGFDLQNTVSSSR